MADEVRLAVRACLAMTALAAAVVIGGCGGGSAETGTASTTSTASSASAEGSGSDAATAGDSAATETRRRLLERTIPKLAESPKQACTYLTDRFLHDNYYSAGERGRQLCEKEARGRKSRRLKSFEIESSGLQEAKVLVLDSAGSKAVFRFVFLNGKWLLDEATSVHA